MGLHALFNRISMIGPRKVFTIIKELLHRFNLKKIKRNNKGDIKWGLGVERPFFFSSKFPISHSTVTITGSQITHDASWPVKYSIVKMNKLGTRIQYFDSVVYYGDYPEGELNHTFQVPNGTGYQLEVFNYFKYHSAGNIRIIQPRQESIGKSSIPEFETLRN